MVFGPMQSTLKARPLTVELLRRCACGFPPNFPFSRVRTKHRPPFLSPKYPVNGGHLFHGKCKCDSPGVGFPPLRYSSLSTRPPLHAASAYFYSFLRLFSIMLFYLMLCFSRYLVPFRLFTSPHPFAFALPSTNPKFDRNEVSLKLSVL